MSMKFVQSVDWRSKTYIRLWSNAEGRSREADKRENGGKRQMWKEMSRWARVIGNGTTKVTRALRDGSWNSMLATKW